MYFFKRRQHSNNLEINEIYVNIQNDISYVNSILRGFFSTQMCELQKNNLVLHFFF